VAGKILVLLAALLALGGSGFAVALIASLSAGRGERARHL